MTAPRIASCPTCSASLTDGDRFCKQCGTDVSGISASLTTRSAEGWQGTPAPAPGPTGHSPWETVLTRLRESTLGEFDVGRELGRGGMAAVFLAHDLALNRKVAIKVMAPGLMMGEGMVQRFRQEAITIANLSHAHIVSIHAVRQSEDLHFFVMQFVEGQSLETVLRTHGRLPVPVVRAVLFQVGSALAYAHRRGVVHRDIKPGNILMSGDGDALVTDFGIAKVAEGPNQTQTGMVVGTPTYMSPEQCYATELDGASDQYSLGIVAYQMLTGQTPFSGSAFAIMKGHTTEPVPSIRAIVPDVPEEVEAAVTRMLAKTPGERFASFGEALAAMGAHAIGEDAPMRHELIRLAAVEERRAALGSLLHTPTSPVPVSRSRSRSGGTPAPTSRPAAETVPMTAVAIAPLAGELEPGDTVTMRAAVRGAETASAIQWSATPSTVAQIDANTGVLTAIAPGTCDVMATVGAVTERMQCLVVPASVAAVRITAPSEPLHVGERVPLSAQAVDKRERPLDAAVEWSTVGTSLELDANGVAHARQVGRAAVTASCNDVYATIVMQVLAARVAHVEVVIPDAEIEIGHAITLTAVLRDAARNELADRAVRWDVDSAVHARIDAAGVFTALTEGTVRVSATAEGVSASRELRIPPARATSVAISFVPDLVRVGDTFALTAVGRDARGTVLARPVIWRSVEPSVATVDVKGGVTVHGPGTARLVARVDDVEASAQFVVHQAPAAFSPTASGDTTLPPASATAVLSAMDSGSAPKNPAAVVHAPGTPIAGKPAAGTAASGNSVSGTPASGIPAPATPASDKPASSKPASGKQASGKPTSGKPGAATPVAATPPLAATATASMSAGAAPAARAPAAPSARPAATATSTPSRGSIPRWAIGAALVPVVAIAIWLGTRGGSEPDAATSPSPTAADSADLITRDGTLAENAVPRDTAADATEGATASGDSSRTSDTLAIQREAIPDPSSRNPEPTPSTRRAELRFVAPASSSLREGESLRLRAAARDPASGRDVQASIRYTSSDRSVARVNASTGEVSAVRAGTVTITAAADNASSGTVRLTVTAAETKVAENQPTRPAEPTTTPTTPSRATTAAADSTPATPAISQAQLAREARTAIESLAAAIGTRDFEKVRAVYQTASSSYAGTMRSMFESSRDIKVSVNSIEVLGNGQYDATVGSTTRVKTDVTFRIVPTSGRAGPPVPDTWPVTLQRTATGWRLLQVGQ